MIHVLKSIFSFISLLSVLITLSSCASILQPYQKTTKQKRVIIPSAKPTNYTWYPESQRTATASERRLLELTNEARSSARTCGTEFFAAAAPLTWNDTLAVIARNHASDMARRGYFSHNTPEGYTTRQRLNWQGYNPHLLAENIAGNYHTPEEVIAGWLESPSHCKSLMNPQFQEMGAGRIVLQGSVYGTYWSQEFAKR